MNKLTMCGCPYGAKITCVPYDYIGSWYFKFAGKSHMMPGMSGGPLVDLVTGKVLGTVSGAIDEKALINPLGALDTML